jgi:hypothetical protein
MMIRNNEWHKIISNWNRHPVGGRFMGNAGFRAFFMRRLASTPREVRADGCACQQALNTLMQAVLVIDMIYDHLRMFSKAPGAG